MKPTVMTGLAAALLAAVRVFAGEPMPVSYGSVYAVGECPAFAVAPNATVRYSVKDFFGVAVTNGTAQADVKGIVALPAAVAFGHFTVDIDGCQTAYAVLPEEPVKRDPFFMIDKNYADPGLCCVMKRNGFGALFIMPPGAKQVVSLTPEQLEDEYRKLTRGQRTGFLASNDFVIRAAADPAVKYHARTEERLTNGLAVVSDEDHRKIRRHFERIAALLADRVTDWIVQEEYDYVREKYRTNVINYLSGYALIAKNACRGLRAGNPKARISVLGCCCYDYYWAPTPFLYSKLLLDCLRGEFDNVALDAYSGNWNGVRGFYTPPEESFRRLLDDAAKLSAEYGGTCEVVNAERCASVDYSAPLDTPICRMQAECTARAMIINKSVTNGVCYSLHLLAIPEPARQQAQDPAKKGISDLGIWKVLIGPNGYRYVPRPAVAAAGTVARKLAFATDPRHFAEPDGLYAEVFTRPDGTCIAPVWTPGDEMAVTVDLPSCVKTDLMGVEQPVSGRVALAVSTSPIFLETTDRAALERAIVGRKVAKRKEAKATEPALKVATAPGEPIALTVPASVFPAAAMMPEYGFVKTGPDAPRADVRLSWSAEGLVVEGEIFNKSYIRRSPDGTADTDDTMVIEAMADGAEKSYGDRRIAVLTFAATHATATGAAYRGVLPFAKLGSDFHADSGARIRLNVRFPIVPRLSDAKSPYCLTWCAPPKGFTDLARRFVPNGHLVELEK